MLKAYAIGFAGAALAVLVAVALGLGLRPEEPAGLRWGGTVYESKTEFQGYLKQRGLSYETWVERHPGLAPWEAPAGAARPVTAAAPAQPQGRAEADDGPLAWLPSSAPVSLPGWWPLAALVLALAAASTLLLPRGAVRAPRLSLHPRGALRAPRPRLDLRFDAVATAGRAALPPLRRAGLLAAGAARRLEVAAPIYGARLLAGARGEARHVQEALQARNVRAGDVAFALLAVLASAMFGLFVFALLSS